MEIDKYEVQKELQKLADEMNTRPCDRITLLKAIYLIGWLDDETYSYDGKII